MTNERSTPSLPDEIRNLRLPTAEGGRPRYRSIYELIPEEDKLYCTETLYGDWNAPVLLLAKDAAHVGVFQDRINDPHDGDPWRHSQAHRGDQEGAATNETLRVLVEEHLPGPKLYGSALAHMLRNDGKMSGELPRGFNCGPVRDHIEWVLRWVTSPAQMPNLRVVGCLGNEAWDVATSSLGALSTNRERMAWPHGDPLETDSAILVRLYHPAARPCNATNAKRRFEWSVLADALREGKHAV